MKKLKIILKILMLFFINTIINITNISNANLESFDISSKETYNPLLGSFLIVLVIIVLYIIYLWGKNKENRKFKDNYNGYSPTNKKIINGYYNRNVGKRQEYQKMFEDSKILENKVEEQIKEIKKEFKKKEFLEYAKNKFLELENAWTKADLKALKSLETSELFEQHKNILELYTNNKTINIREDIYIKSIMLYEFKSLDKKDYITIKLNSKMKDYIVNIENKEIVNGNKYTEIEYTYYLTFVSDENNWKISNLERV